MGAGQECRPGDQGMMGGRRTQSSDCYGRALVRFFHLPRWRAAMLFKWARILRCQTSRLCITLDWNNAYNAIWWLGMLPHHQAGGKRRQQRRVLIRCGGRRAVGGFAHLVSQPTACERRTCDLFRRKITLGESRTVAGQGRRPGDQEMRLPRAISGIAFAHGPPETLSLAWADLVGGGMAFPATIVPPSLCGRRFAFPIGKRPHRCQGQDARPGHAQRLATIGEVWEARGGGRHTGEGQTKQETAKQLLFNGIGVQQ